MTLNQRVPTNSVGGMVEWSKTFMRRHYVTAGTDWRWTDGDSEEDALDPLTGPRQPSTASLVERSATWEPSFRT